MNPRQKAIHLIALATNNPSSEEARTAAIQAAALIKEHNLLQVTEEEARAIPPVGPGFMGFVSGMLGAIAASGIMDDINVAAMGMSAQEIAALKTKNAILQKENGILRAKLRDAASQVPRGRRKRRRY